MIAISHQPNFLPYMGFFHKLSKADVWVASDDVLFSKKGMHNWQYIMENGNKVKVTVPVSAHHDSRLCDVSLSMPSDNVPKLCKRFMVAYHGAEHHAEGKELCCFIESLSGESRMIDFNLSLTIYLMEKFKLRAKVIRGTTLAPEGRKDDRIIDICRKIGADTYLSGKGAMAYHEPDKYRQAGINLTYSDYVSLDYGSEPNLSVIDYVFKCGFDAERAGFA